METVNSASGSWTIWFSEIMNSLTVRILKRGERLKSQLLSKLFVCSTSSLSSLSLPISAWLRLWLKKRNSLMRSALNSLSSSLTATMAVWWQDRMSIPSFTWLKSARSRLVIMTRVKSTTKLLASLWVIQSLDLTESFYLNWTARRQPSRTSALLWRISKRWKNLFTNSGNKRTPSELFKRLKVRAGVLSFNYLTNQN